MSSKIKQVRDEDKVSFGLRNRLVLIILLAGILPIATSSVISSVENQMEFTENWHETLHGIGTQKAHFLSTYYEDRRVDSQYIADTTRISQFTQLLTVPAYMPSNTEDNVNKINSVLINALTTYDFYREIYIASPSGTIVAQQNQTGWTHGHSVGQDRAGSEYIESVVDNATHGYTFLSGLELSVDGTFLRQTLSVPILNVTDDFVGILVFYIDIDHVGELMHDTLGLGETGETYIVNHDHHWLTETKSDYYIEALIVDTNHETLLNDECKLPQEGITEAFEKEKEIFSEEEDFRGVDVLGVYIYLEVADNEEWVLVAEIDNEEAMAPVTRMLTITIIIGISAVVLIMIVAFLFGNSIAKPVLKMAQYATEIANDDLTTEMTYDSNYETGVLARHLRQMHQNLIKLMAHTRNVAHHVDLSAESLSHHADEVSTSSENIAGTQQQISKGAANQVRELVETQKRFVLLNADIHEIKLKTDQISQVADLIAGIAQQTNMLALNAAIEAARAGEAGRGFNVVADQVRKLADESSKAVSNTETMLQEIKSITENLEKHSEEMLEMIENVEKHSEENSAHTEEAAAAAEAQTASMEEITTEAHKLLELAEDLDEELGHVKVTDEDLAKFIDVAWTEGDEVAFEKSVKTEKITPSKEKTVKFATFGDTPEAEKEQESASIEFVDDAF